ncbi:MAG: DEAD/DEAH box helicase, partial [Candidatus Cloacimonetes bacterium]|nr:DEAD/DEAH box helicase [Candidatus Cloacimonadota bacterium]
LYETILFNYSMNLLGLPQRKKPIKKEHALRFADILSKSYGQPNSEKHRAWAQEIIALLNAIYPDDAMIKAYATSVLANIGNYRGLQLIKSKYKNTSFLDELYQSFDLDYLQMPHQEDKYFFHSQKEIYDHLSDKSFSYSGPTSMGKSLVMRTFIKDKIMNNFKGNFAILVPTKALISEISSNIIKNDLQDELSNKNYKVVTSGNSLFFKQDNLNYIMVMTPERLLYTLISYPEMSIDYLFIDEAHKLSEADGRATFYFKVTDMLIERPRKPHVILASPNIPNPEIYLEALPSEQINNPTYLRTTFTPVSQMKYVLDTVTKEFKVFNERTNKKNPFKTIYSLNEEDTILILIQKIIQKDLNKSNIVYCSGRDKTVEMARNFAESLPYLNNKTLDGLAKEIEDEIHSDYYLADIIRKGVSYHVGYLPLHIRSKIEELYRNRDIKTIFCTSTLIEGVNLPADNLIVISVRIGRKGNMSQVEFKNLLGRVGRIEYNLYGNVFIIRDSNMGEKTMNNLLLNDVENQEISLKTQLSDETKEYIINQFLNGSSQLNPLPEQKPNEYDLMRKTGLILLKDITKNRNSVVRKQFNHLLDEQKVDNIKLLFEINNTSKPKPDDDINVSLDQTENLISAINNGLKYPELLDGRVQYEDLVSFLTKLRNIFKWDIYEKTTLGLGSRINYYAVILARWMNGYGLSFLLKDTIDYAAENNGSVNKNYEIIPYNGSQEHKNLIIGDTLQIIENVILFSLANYLLRFSTEYKKLKTNNEPFDNDWYEYVEFGSTNALTIFFQRNGLTRETADYIRRHQEYVVYTQQGYKLKKSLLDCGKQSVTDEITDILYNVPELFINE